MSLDARYIPLYNLQQYFVDKSTLAPLSNGYVYFCSDINRSIPKRVFELSSKTGDYSYVALPNPVRLGAAGTPVDDSGADIVIYAYPYDLQGNVELYYVVVQDQFGQTQFTREAVPSSVAGGTPSGSASIYNYIPNGQFLLHTDLPDDGLLLPGKNITAQGGWFVELNDPLFSTNHYTYTTLGFTEDPSASPRYWATYTAGTPSGSDSKKWIGVQFNDVNKFSANNDVYTFAFWAEGSVNIPISILVVKNFGTTGSPQQEITEFTDTITTDGQIYQYQFQFGLNDGEIVDLINQDDFVAVVIALPTDIAFSFIHTDFVLTNGAIEITSFPLQTNADMVTRTNDGWTDLPATNGYDLYLPKVQTRYGYKYDRSSIGMGGFTFAQIVSPLSTSPLPETNIMAFDGATYIYKDYSVLGIPFARLGDFLINNSPVANTPMFGTGANFVTAYVNNGDDTIFRLTVNSDGAGVNPAVDGIVPTGFTFTTVPDYNGSLVGSNTLNYTAFSSGVAPNQLICKSDFAAFEGQQNFDNNYADPNDSGFTVTNFDFLTGLYAQQTVAFSIDTLPASSLIVGSGSPGLSFFFYNDVGQTSGYYFWFNVSGEIDPTPPAAGLDPVEIVLNSTDTDVDVANKLIEAMKAFQITDIKVGVTPAPGSYFTFQANPSGTVNYYVWYSDEAGGSDPLVPGAIGINVLINSSDAFDVIASKTLITLNKYQYAVPDGPGMYLRNYDANAVWDYDALTRWSTVTGLTGANLGTFEYSQILSHIHQANTGQADGNTNDFRTTSNNANDRLTNFTGGSETRTVNMNVNYFIRY